MLTTMLVVVVVFHVPWLSSLKWYHCDNNNGLQSSLVLTPENRYWAAFVEFCSLKLQLKEKIKTSTPKLLDSSPS